MSNLPKFIFSLLFGVLLVSSLVFGFLIYKNSQQLSNLERKVNNLLQIAEGLVDYSVIETTQELQPITQVEISQTSSTQLEQLETEVATLESKLSEIDKQVSNLVSLENVPTTTTQIIESSSVKEYTVFLGSGTTTSTNWIDLLTAQGEIDLNQYGSVVDIRFEGTLSIIGGEVRARIINVTTGQVISESEITHNDKNYTWKTSLPLRLQSGNNLYRVQLRSSSGELAIIDSSRIKISVK